MYIQQALNKTIKGIPGKGCLLNKISAFWFDKLRDVVPNHVITTDVDSMPEDVRQYRSQLLGRSMLVRKATVVQIEAIVRGYLTGILGIAELAMPILMPQKDLLGQSIQTLGRSMASNCLQV